VRSRHNSSRSISALVVSRTTPRFTPDDLHHMIENRPNPSCARFQQKDLHEVNSDLRQSRSDSPRRQLPSGQAAYTFLLVASSHQYPRHHYPLSTRDLVTRQVAD
jgi:hypothetical protein